MTATTIATAYRDACVDLKWVVLETAATADNAYTVSVDLQSYGIAEDGLLGIYVFGHTTLNSVIAVEDCTTVVTSGTVAITGGSVSGTDKMRVILLIGRSEV